jgi:hypothetical protein
VAILDFLSASVETQPGLVEVFFDFNAASAAEAKVGHQLIVFSYFVSFSCNL